MRGLNSKLKSLYLNSFNFQSLVIVFTETWLKPSISDSEILCSRYCIFRRDRIGKNCGGVLIVVNSKLFAESVLIPIIF